VWPLAAAGVALVAAAAGVTYALSSSSEPAVAPAATSSASASAAPATTAAHPVDGGTYDSPLMLVDAMRKGRVYCTDYEAIAQPKYAISRGICHVADEEYTIGIYASSSDARAQPALEAELSKGLSGVDMVLGRNWTVGCPDGAAARTVASALGGEVFHVPA